MKSICLIGFMGSGKTTLGKELAKKLDAVFLDTDEEIIKWREMDIPEIFQLEGEKRFREYETEVLKGLPQKNTVIATGGGIIEAKMNRDILKNDFFTVYLKTSFEEIKQRLASNKNRPLWNQEMEKKEQLYDSRQYIYEECADQIIQTDDYSAERIVQMIMKSIVQQ
ncbi:shikimate kinase [Salinibacillus aidingensis]|uniref:Shikimate kinase n=1 Tax=Salinibacillus aidingensis TaxID=237684 RepID=A0ABN1ARL2_9BACI